MNIQDPNAQTPDSAATEEVAPTTQTPDAATTEEAIAMEETAATEATATPTPDTPSKVLKLRIFKTGSVSIVEDASMASMTNEQIRDILKFQYPEIVNSDMTVQETPENITVTFTQKAGRKG